MRVCAGDIVEANLVADFLAEPHAALVGDARGEHARGEAAWLEHHDLAIAQQAVVEQHLRHLRGFARAGGRLQDHARVLAKMRDKRVLELENG